MNGLRILSCLLALALGGCQLLPEKPLAQTSANTPTGPKPRMKAQLQMPPAAVLLAWHAEECGEGRGAAVRERYLEETRLRVFLARYCRFAASQPGDVLARLKQLKAYRAWPTEVALYLNMLQRPLEHSMTQLNKQQKLKEEMNKTMADLAAIERQLLGGETAGEAQ